MPSPAVDLAVAAVNHFLVGVTGLTPRDVALRDGNQSQQPPPKPRPQLRLAVHLPQGPGPASLRA